MKIKFTIPGNIVGKQRPKFAKCGNFVQAYTPQKTVNYENLVKLAFQQYAKECECCCFEKTIPLKVSIQAFFQIPASVSKKKAEQMQQGHIRPTKKPDSDNVAKSILDALNGIAFHDDAQVAELTVSKFYALYPKAIVTIEELFQ